MDVGDDKFGGAADRAGTDDRTHSPGFGEAAPLNPTQQRVLDLLGMPLAERPQFDAGLGPDLRADLEAGLAPLVGDDPDASLWLAKHDLSSVHGCEARYLAERAAGFAWSVPLARGTIVHKAVELSVHWRGEAAPLDLVDEAIARLGQDSSGIGEWLRRCDEVDLAELRSAAGASVTAFGECFPPIKAAWHPVTEGPVRVDLLANRVSLKGRIDLSLGRATGTTAGKVLIDLKTGGPNHAHLEDLRFYALLETIRIGTPPRLLASFYLDAGQAQPEVVTAGLLDAAVRRTVDGAVRLTELAAGADPVKRVGTPCRWCPLIDSCAEGRAHLFADDDLEAFDDPID